ncbi:MAG: efflux RND transporter periplasmic adaptor subunit [Comamonadaceae bacterium]|nr:efflux RND transporter periplasmic adaptor subunit [Comamonadaceae bacterium]
MKKKIVWIVIALVVVAGVVLGLTVFGKGKNGKVEYRTETLGRGDIEALVVTSGTLNPIETVDVGAQVSGKIEKLYADFNSVVTKGQVVAELDQEPLLMKIQQNEANYKSRVASLERSKVSLQTAEKAYERAKSLFAKELISIEEMDAAEANYLNAKSDLVSSEATLAQAKSTLDLSKVDLGYSVIKAPVDGVVITRKVNVGQTLQSNYAAPVLFQVATDLTKMKVECSVDESDIGKVKEGQKVRFTVEAYPEPELRRHRPAGPLLARDGPERRHLHDHRQRRQPREEAPARHDGDGVHHRRRGQERPEGLQRGPALHAHPPGRRAPGDHEGVRGPDDGQAPGRRRPAGRTRRRGRRPRPRSGVPRPRAASARSTARAADRRAARPGSRRPASGCRTRTASGA